MMFECRVSGLISGLSPIAEVATHAIIKDYSGLDKINLSVKDDCLMVSAFNGRVSAVNEISEITANDLEYKSTSNGDVTVGAKNLISALESFSQEELLVIKLNKVDGGGQELVISKKSDSDEYQTLPCYDKKVTIPEQATEYGIELTVDKDIFVASFQKIKFAIGFEDNNPKYLHYVLFVDSNNNQMRYVAGTGGRFAVLDIETKTLFQLQNKKNAEFLFPKESLLAIHKILHSIECEKIIISKTKANEKNAQMLFTVGSVKIIFIELDKSITYPDVADIIDVEDISNKFIMSIDDWALIGKGIAATYDEDMKKESRIHRASIKTTDNGETFIVESNDIMKASRKINIIDKEVKSDIERICISPYLKEIAKHGKGNVQVEIDNANSKPVVIRYHASEKVQSFKDIKMLNESLDMSERFSIFFVTCNQNG